MKTKNRAGTFRIEPPPVAERQGSVEKVTAADSDAPSRCARITGVRPDVTGVFLTLLCPACGHEGESYQPTIGGFTVGDHTCPSCAAVYEVEQKDFETALDRHWPRGSLREMVELTAVATHIAETWHGTPELAAALTHSGVRLAPGMERELLAFIVAGLVQASGVQEVG